MLCHLVAVPGELKAALEEGASLLVKGAPGGGKTSFALSIIEEFKDGTCVYVSTRTSREAFYRYFPWVREVLGFSGYSLLDVCPLWDASPLKVWFYPSGARPLSG